ncbi:MAG TPA: GGDEF domain-containing protein [Thermoanaerobaculia bacterium]|jgi:diguanylate cyclase (GGDEF)-like protein|nr:GGDEF domain-containing protein [Thermoanaerobaculia bacterium]
MNTIRIAGFILAIAAAWFDRRAAVTAIALLAIAFEVLLRRAGESEHRAVRDSLTGVFNRRWIDESVGDVSANTGVIVADVDHFKSYNDRWGHTGGDVLLRQLALLMQRLVSAEDVVCRVGGEEFVIVVQAASFDELRERAERLVAESRRLIVQFDGEPLGAITLSAGIAIAPHHGNTIERLICAADRALYAAKRAGRDRVAIPPHQIVGRDAA